MKAKKDTQKIKAPLSNSWWVRLLSLFMIVILAVSCGSEEPAAIPDKPLERPDSESITELENSINNIIRERDFDNATLDIISITADREMPDDYYLAQIYFDFDARESLATGSGIMRRNSDIILGLLANRGVSTLKEASVIWNDDYNNRTLQFDYRYRNGRRQNRFSITSIKEK